MKSMVKWMLGAAVIAGGLGLGTAPAKAAEFGVYVGGPVAYVPPCPGPGYTWVAGYYANGYWVPGRWNFIAVRGPGYRVAPVYGHGWVDHRFDRDHDRFDRDHFRR